MKVVLNDDQSATTLTRSNFSLAGIHSDFDDQNKIKMN